MKDKENKIAILDFSRNVVVIQSYPHSIDSETVERWLNDNGYALSQCEYMVGKFIINVSL